MKNDFPNDVLAALKTHELWAFTYIYNDAKVWLFSIAHSIVEDETVAQDLVQELFIDFWEQRLYLQVSSSVKGYLIRSVKHRALNYKKRETYLSRLKNHFTGKKSIVLPELKTEQAELKESLEKAIRKLPVACGMAFMLHYIEGLSHSTIAHEQGISTNTVRNQISHALKLLRKELKYLKSQ
jgi:RNA polymerase sigma-70 factor (family 1)